MLTRWQPATRHSITIFRSTAWIPAKVPRTETDRRYASATFRRQGLRRQHARATFQTARALTTTCLILRRRQARASATTCRFCNSEAMTSTASPRRQNQIALSTSANTDDITGNGNPSIDFRIPQNGWAPYESEDSGRTDRIVARRRH
jgi:hypothetical protein